MKREQVIKVTVTRYYDPAEINIDYSDLLESVGIGDGMFSPTANGKKWLRENLVAVASYDKYSVDQGHIEIREFLDTPGDEEPPEYTFEVVEFTTHDDGEVTEEVIHIVKDETINIDALRDDLVIKDSGVAIEPKDFSYGTTRAEEDSEVIQDTILFYKTHGRVPTLRDLLLLQEAKASVALDKGDGIQTRKPSDANLDNT